MKTVVLIGFSCLLMAGVFFILTKKSQAGNVLSFKGPINSTFSLNANESDKSAKDVTSAGTEKKKTNSPTLIDSNWVDDPTFQKAAGSDLLSEGGETPQTEIAPPQAEAPEKTTPPLPKRKKGQLQEEPVPNYQQLILKLNPDTTAKKKVPVDVV